MNTYDNIIIGFGKGGKTLAAALAGKGEKTVLVEQSADMYGGSCINVACIPSKSLEKSARLSAAMGGGAEKKKERYRSAVEEKRGVTAKLRQKNYDKLIASGVEVLTGKASFLDEHRLFVSFPDGAGKELYGERIFINTGSRPFLPPIQGLSESRRAYTSETMMELEELPERLLIIGGGYIGLEFASYYTNFGSQVTVVQDGETFLPREDKEVADAVLARLADMGIRVILSAQVLSVKDEDDMSAVTVTTGGKKEVLYAHAILAATGRRPNLEGLHPEKAGVTLSARGAVETDEHLLTSVPHIWAMGDVTGGQQFTYISLDDSRIVRSQLSGDGARTTKNRGAIPYSVFLDPPLSRVGLTEADAKAAGYDVKIAKLPVSAIPRSLLQHTQAGLLKAVIDAETDRVLGAHLYCVDSHELINLIKLAMDEGIPYTTLRDGVYNHPTMSEALNELFARVE